MVNKIKNKIYKKYKKIKIKIKNRKMRSSYTQVKVPCQSWLHISQGSAPRDPQNRSKVYHVDFR
jgi:hypothetical protein